MSINTQTKARAIALRKSGKSYSEILKTIPVAKSTLALWLREVGLSKAQKQRLTEKRVQSAMRGAQKRRTQREDATRDIQSKAFQEIGRITERELFLLGTALYWAEGSKQKVHAVSTGIIFANSDPFMIEIYLKWLTLIGVKKEDIVFEIYIHEHVRERIHEIKNFWSKRTKSSINMFDKVYYKKNSLHLHRRNTGENYHGVLRVKVKASTNLNRRVTGWINGICNNTQ